MKKRFSTFSALILAAVFFGCLLVTKVQVREELGKIETWEHQGYDCWNTLPTNLPR